MNERIRELLKQAEERYPRHLAVAVPEVALRQDALEKFAELIVQECIATIENAVNGYEDYRNQIEDGMRNHCIDLIKNKFGIKE